MTAETSVFVEFKNIAGIEFECRQCGTRTAYKIVANIDHLPNQCSNCHKALPAAWAQLYKGVEKM
jgi:hypothetical protein